MANPIPYVVEAQGPKDASPSGSIPIALYGADGSSDGGLFDDPETVFRGNVEEAWIMTPGGVPFKITLKDWATGSQNSNEERRLETIDLRARATALENQVADLESQVSSLESRATNSESQVSDLEARIATLEALITD